MKGVIAGGGTGGHLFPGIAVARELEKRFESPEILFVVGRQRMESEILSRYGYRVESINVEGIKGRGWKKGLAVLFKLPKSFFQSVSVITRHFSRTLFLELEAILQALSAWQPSLRGFQQRSMNKIPIRVLPTACYPDSWIAFLSLLKKAGHI